MVMFDPAHRYSGLSTQESPEGSLVSVVYKFQREYLHTKAIGHHLVELFVYVCLFLLCRHVVGHFGEVVSR